MLGLPTGNWSEGQPEPGDGAPAELDWEAAGSVNHVFTHFSLRLHLFRGVAVKRGPDGIWWPAAALADAGMPTLFAKAAAQSESWQRAA